MLGISFIEKKNLIEKKKRNGERGVIHFPEKVKKKKRKRKRKELFVPTKNKHLFYLFL